MANSALSTMPPQQHPTPKNSRGKIIIREASADLVVLRGAPKIATLPCLHLINFCSRANAVSSGSPLMNG